MSGRYVTAPLEVSEAAIDSLTGRGDPQQRYRVYRLCICEACEGHGKLADTRCPECRGEGKTLDHVANAGDEAGLGALIITNAREGAFDGCPIGILEDGGSWLVSPWLPSARNVSDAGRTLAGKRWQKGETNG